MPKKRQGIIDLKGFQQLLETLSAAGYELIGPKAEDGAIVYESVESIEDFPKGYRDEQNGGRYRLTQTDSDALFGTVVGPHSWKRYLYPPEQTLWTARKEKSGFSIEEPDEVEPQYAFIGVRACELAAIAIQDRVFDNGDFAEPGYLARRKNAFLVAVNCTRAGGTCFCASMDTGPKAKDGYDLVLTELTKGGHRFVVEAGTERGDDILARLTLKTLGEKDQKQADKEIKAAAKSMGREMIKDVASVLGRNLEHRQWRKVAERCLNCANCTMVCPTCFCSTMEDLTSLDGSEAQRVRKWDSCFTVDFSYIHGGPIRRDAASRYRQWITHKLSHWHEQFGTSGCTGCGRCITWCPVGIDITEEARAIRDAEGG